MNIKLDIDIKEDCGELKKMMLREKDGRKKERIHILYLFGSGICRSIEDLSGITGRSRGTVSTWIKKYKKGGIGCLCKRNGSPGRKRIITDDIINMLKEKLGNPEGFGSYDEIQKQVESRYGRKISKKTLYHTCHYKLQSVSKVPRPYNPKQNPEDIRNFGENFRDDIKKRNRKRRNTGK